jgi:SanA protein
MVSRPPIPAPRRAIHLVAMALAVTATLGASGAAASTFWVNWSTRTLRYTGIDQVPARDVAIVPGVGTGSNRMPRHLEERLAPALGLYRAHKVRAILVSGIGVPPKRDEVTSMVRWLRTRGVPPQDIISDPAGFRTLDTMQRAAHLLNVNSAVVCTQGVFIARALFLARAAGIDAVGLEAPSPIGGSGPIFRSEAAKSGLAMLDTYVTGRQPKYLDAHGARIGQALVAPQPAAFNFLTSAISNGTAASQVATRP